MPDELTTEQVEAIREAEQGGYGNHCTRQDFRNLCATALSAIRERDEALKRLERVRGPAERLIAHATLPARMKMYSAVELSMAIGALQQALGAALKGGTDAD